MLRASTTPNRILSPNGTLWTNGTLSPNGTLWTNGTLSTNGTLWTNGTLSTNGTSSAWMKFLGWNSMGRRN